MDYKDCVYITKSVRKDMSSNHDPDFKYPTSGFVEALDWAPTADCGEGLHGFLWGEGGGTLGEYSDDYVWLLIKVDPADGLIDLRDKVKFRRGEIIQVGTYREIAQAILPFLPNDRLYRVIGLEKTIGDHGIAAGGFRSTLTGGNRSTLTGGDGSTLTGGDYSTLTGGFRSTLTGGDESTLTGGDCSTLTGGDGSTLTGGNYSTLTGGYQSTVTGGYCSTLTGGNRSTLTGGDGSTLTGGDYSTLTGGFRSTLTGGYQSTVTGGDGSVLIIEFYNGACRVKKVAVVGENGIEPGVSYCLDNNGNFVKTVC